jgi:hypothetical protein
LGLSLPPHFPPCLLFKDSLYLGRLKESLRLVELGVAELADEGGVEVLLREVEPDGGGVALVLKVAEGCGRVRVMVPLLEFDEDIFGGHSFSINL